MTWYLCSHLVDSASLLQAENRASKREATDGGLEGETLFMTRHLEGQREKSKGKCV